MKKIIFFFLIVLLFNLKGILSASGREVVTFEHISIEDGLSQSSVYCTLQDSKGFMWFGTFFGLDKYDGRAFTFYMNDLTLPGSTAPMYLQSICEDRSGTLWCGTRMMGLCKFDRKRGAFVLYKHDPADPGSLSQNSVNSVIEDSSGTLWVGTDGGLDRFDLQTGVFRHYKHAPGDSNSLSHDLVTTIYEDSSGGLWIGTGSGLNKFDDKTDSFSRYTHTPGNPAGLSGNFITAIHEDRAGVLWIGTRQNGLNMFDSETGTFTVYRHDTANPGSLAHNYVSALHEDSSGVLWVGTAGGGLNAFDSREKRFTSYRYDPDNPGSLSGDIITTIYEDRSGILWCGALAKGLNKLNRRKEIFRHYKNEPGNPNSLSHPIVRGIYEDRTGNLWVAARDGLNIFDRERTTVRHHRGGTGDTGGGRLDLSVCFYEDRDGVLWIGTVGRGLIKYVPGTGTVASYTVGPGNPPDLRNNTVRTICADSSGALWLATLQGGIVRFDPASEEFTHFPLHPGKGENMNNYDVFPIQRDKDGNLWIGTLGNGVVVWDPAAERVTRRYEAVPAGTGGLNSNHVIAIYPDRTGSVWMGTFGGGLNRIDRQTGTFTHYTKKEGLASDIIYGILEDNRGNLWLSTNKGISRFNRSTGMFKNYGPGEGLKCYEFNNGAQYKSQSGEMFFGGTDGFVTFHPDNMETNPYVPPVVITGSKLFDQPVDISETKEIVLSYKQNVFSFEFAALDYTNPSRNQYKFKMDGLHDDWIPLGNKNEAMFTNLEPGEYVFRVKGSNNDGVWNEEGTSLKIVITPPFWKTWWFRVLVLAAVFFLVFAWHRSRVNRLSLQLKTEKEMNRFFTKYKISAREQEILLLIMKGKSNKDIENILFISLPTVKSHIYSIYKKVKVKNRLELIRFVQETVTVK